MDNINYLIALSIVVVIISVVLLLRERLVPYGRPIGSFYSTRYNPRPKWIATNHNYGWICDLGGHCKLVRGGLLSKEECKKKCIAPKADWTPPWRLIE